MPKFKTKPTFVEAEQFKKTKTPWPKGVECVGGTSKAFLKTPTGNIDIKNGDWVVNGKVMSDEVFQSIYVPVEKGDKE